MKNNNYKKYITIRKKYLTTRTNINYQREYIITGKYITIRNNI